MKLLVSALFFLLILPSTHTFAGEPLGLSSQHAASLNLPGSFRGAGPNVKLLPAIYWNTLGLEFEVPAGVWSFGVMGMYKFNERFGNDKNFKVRPEDYQKAGFRAEVFGRYWYRGQAPAGLFVEGKVFYNTIIYFDGNPMPYTLYNRWKELDGLRSPTEISKPSPFGAGIATGIQIYVIQGILVANIKGGLDLNQDNADNGNKIFLSVYLQPSIGISF